VPKLALLQATGTPGDVGANLAALRDAAGRATAEGASLLITPEAFVTGYDIGAATLGALAEPLDGPCLSEAARIAADLGIAIVAGWAERSGDRVFNAATLFDRAGRPVLTHRKAHLYGAIDHAAFAPGEAFATAEIDGLRVGLLVCFDIEFPEPARALALAGAQLIAVPTSLMAPDDVIARTVVPARALENQVFVAYANRIGREATLDYVGQSTVAGPDGAVIAVAGATEETLLLADIDPAAIAVERARHDYLAERRPSLYGTLTT